jgi:hypothetical protein
MTRETKVGMAVGTTFLCLLAIVVASKLRTPVAHVEPIVEETEPQNGDGKLPAADAKPPAVDAGPPTSPVAQGPSSSSLQPRSNGTSSGLPAVSVSELTPLAPSVPAALPSAPPSNPLVQAAQTQSLPTALPPVELPTALAPSTTPTANADAKPGLLDVTTLPQSKPFAGQAPTTLKEGAPTQLEFAPPVARLPAVDPLASLPTVAQPKDPLAQKVGSPTPVPIEPQDPLVQKSSPAPAPIQITQIAPTEPAKNTASTVPTAPSLPAPLEGGKQSELPPVVPPLVAQRENVEREKSGISLPMPSPLPPVVGVNANAASPPVTAKVPEVPKASIGTIGMPSDHVPVTPPLTTPIPGATSSGASVTAIPVHSELPKVTSHSDDVHLTQTESTFEELSNRYYQSPKYARALLEYNRQHVLARPNIQQNPPTLQPNQAIYYPHPSILEQRYGQLISSAAPSIGRISNPASVAAGAALQVDLTSSAAPVQLRQPMPLNASAGASPTSDRTITYRVRQTAHIFAIAQETLGDGHAWTEILRLNPQLQRVDLNHTLIQQGFELQLPANAKVH